LWIGKRSYGLYVWHWPVYFLSGRLLRPAVAIPFGIVAAFVVAALSYRFIETPFLNLKSRFSASREREAVFPGEVVFQRGDLG
jgi:peptidoglycan/LPS O-acetylase OafA/YrhL